MTPRTAAARTRDLCTARSRLLKLLLRAPGWSIALVAVNLLSALSPTLTALAVGWLVARVNELGGRDEFGWGSLVFPLATVAALFIVYEVIGALANAGHFALGGHIDRSVRHEVRVLALTRLTALQLETPHIVDDLQRASNIGEGQMRSPGAAVVGQLYLLSRIGSALAGAVVLSVALSPVLAIVLLSLAMLIRALIRRRWMRMTDAWDARERFRRRSVYWTELGWDPAAAKDIRIFGLGNWLIRRRTASFTEWLAPLWPIRLRALLEQRWVVALTLLAGLLALLVPALAFRRGAIGIDQLVVSLMAAWVVFRICSMGREAYDIEYGQGSVAVLYRLRAMGTAAEDPQASSDAVAFDTAITCRKLTFAYPGTDEPVIRDLELEIGKGEVVAIVGRNGVGKTTLIKLLTGLYRPDSGAVLIDDRDLREISSMRWRERVSVVFQDFGKYPGTLAENIAIGASEHFEDRCGVEDAANRAGIDRWIASMSNGYDTPLGREFNGVDLSGGQWQSVAIARAFFAARHGRDLIVFDEPTTHLDAQSEAAFFERAIDAVDDASIVLISHRLGTIRNADRIVLLGPEGVLEQGSHDHLLTLGGEYARFFTKQAERFVAS